MFEWRIGDRWVGTRKNISYDEFIEDELEFRKQLEYPPFTRLAKLEFSDKYPNKAQNEMLKVKNCLEKKYPILGFGPSPITKIANKYRYQILLKGVNFHKFIFFLSNLRPTTFCCSGLNYVFHYIVYLNK